MLKMESDPNAQVEALKCADEAVILFREVGDLKSEASALLLSADALRIARNYQESKEAANEARKLFQETSDSAGEELANQVLGWLDEIEQQLQEERKLQQAMMAAPQMMQQPQQGMPQMQMLSQPIEAPQDMPQQATSVARVERERGAALDMSAGLDLVAVKGKVLEIASRITGADDGEIELDTPLMEAGLTSNSAILMRDELAQELPGVSLPVTLVFDYPSVGAMADLILESSNKKK